jgi:hypothetical protein
MQPRGAHKSGLYAFRPETEHRTRTYLLEEPIGSQRFPLPPNVAGCLELWRGVVDDAVRLAVAEQPSPKWPQYERERSRQILAAREWIGSSDFAAVCELAQLNPVPLRRAVEHAPEVVLPPVKERKVYRGGRPRKDWWELSWNNPRRRKHERAQQKEIALRVREAHERERELAQIGPPVRRGRPPASAEERAEREQREQHEAEVKRLELRQRERAAEWLVKHRQRMAELQGTT